MIVWFDFAVARTIYMNLGQGYRESQSLRPEKRMGNEQVVKEAKEYAFADTLCLAQDSLCKMSARDP